MCSFDPLLCCEESCIVAGMSPDPRLDVVLSQPAFVWSDTCIDERPGEGGGCPVPDGWSAPFCPWQIVHESDTQPGKAVVNNCQCECCHPDFSSGAAVACNVYDCEQAGTCISNAVAGC
eukprot:SAG22_NODE_693_length_7872_cov_13.111797_5_plen_119_part_00